MICRPFPKLPQSFLKKYGNPILKIRSFGTSKQDLDVDFPESRPVMITEVIRACTVTGNSDKLDSEFFWDMSLGKRIECLFNIATEENSNEVPFELRCGNPNCEKPMDVTITSYEIAKMQSNIDQIEITLPIGNSTDNYFFRLPTGSDQRKWMKESASSSDGEIEKAIIKSLWVQKPGQELPLDELSIHKIGEELKSHDPLVDFKLTTFCPYCNFEFCPKLNLEKLLINQLSDIKDNLISHVHQLARVYHWREDWIVKIPKARRQEYLSLIQRAAYA